MAQIVLNPFGSFGDLHPYMALATGLQQRGHEPLIATSTVYREKVEAKGLGFAPVRPDISKLLDDPQLLSRILHPRRGTEFLFREFLIPQVRAAYQDLYPVCQTADLLITHLGGLAGPLVAEKIGVRWLSVVLQPSAIFSRYDPPVIAEATWLRHGYQLGDWFARWVQWSADRTTNRWATPIHNFRQELGLRAGKNPIMAGQFSPTGTLALFSRHFAAPQPDWPAPLFQPGFLFYDEPGAVPELVQEEATAERSLQEFLARGDPPILFTLGSSAVLQSGRFFEESRQAAQILGRRAILLTGRNTQAGSESPQILSLPYVRFSEVMPHMAAVVHQGGIGTTAQTLRAGRRALVVPWSNDQPDNAYRLQRLGVARVLDRGKYGANAVACELNLLLGDDQMQARAESIGCAIGQERSLDTACDAVEKVLTAER